MSDRREGNLKSGKMADALIARYWCHMCNQMVAVMELEIKCPNCDSGFVEEMVAREDTEDTVSLGSDRSLSLWAPILLGMMGGSSRRRRHYREEEDDEESDHDRLETILRRRRWSSAALVQLLQGMQAELSAESNNPESDAGRERESALLVNPFDQLLMRQGSFDTNHSHHSDGPFGASLGDYFVGPGLELLLQHLAENDPNRYGTPPARKEAVDAMPTVEIGESLSCPVCLEEFAIGTKAKEMHCKHKFHSGCILPWLELHSCCPVCRFQMPADGSKDSNANGNTNRVERTGGISGDDGGNGRRSWLQVPWPFSGLFSSSGSRSGASTSSSSSANGNYTNTDEN